MNTDHYVAAVFLMMIPILSVIIIGIWADAHPAQEPADAKLLLMLVNKLVLI